MASVHTRQAVTALKAWEVSCRKCYEENSFTILKERMHYAISMPFNECESVKVQVKMSVAYENIKCLIRMATSIISVKVFIDAKLKITGHWYCEDKIMRSCGSNKVVIGRFLEISNRC